MSVKTLLSQSVRIVNAPIEPIQRCRDIGKNK